MSRLRMFATVLTFGETACMQHECDAGLEPHMLAIFMQQVCSAVVIL
jgi:hypothetical protein